MGHYRRFTITLRHTKLGRTPLDEWSARRRYLYLTTQNTHNRQTSTPPARFDPTTPASEWPQTHALDRAATRIGYLTITITNTNDESQNMHYTYTNYQIYYFMTFHKLVALFSFSDIYTSRCTNERSFFFGEGVGGGGDNYVRCVLRQSTTKSWRACTTVPQLSTSSRSSLDWTFVGSKGISSSQPDIVDKFLSMHFFTFLIFAKSSTPYRAETTLYTQFSVPVEVQGEHKVFPWLQTLLTRKLHGIQNGAHVEMY